MSQAFYRKWRPQTWDEVVAQDHVVQTLRNAVRTGRTGHAYLLAGPRGTGKTTTARLLAKALNCLDPDPGKRPCDQCEHCKSLDEGRFLDLIEIDAASNTSVDDVRDLREKINYSPSQGTYKVYIIDEVHMLSTAAFNALLKTLEEPPPHAVFILATTEVHKIPATILSRCQRYEFRRIPVPEIVKYLRTMAAEEKLEVDEEALQLIARQATGAMRDAISLLDQLSSTGERVTLAEAQVVLGTATSKMVLILVDAILSKDAASGMKVVQSALDAGTDARQFGRQVVDYLRSVLLIRMGNADQVDATPELRASMAEHAHAFDTPRLLEAIRLFNLAATDTRSSWHPGLALEMAFAQTLEEPVVSQAPTVQQQAAAAPVQAPQAARPQRAEPPPFVPAKERDLSPDPFPEGKGSRKEPEHPAATGGGAQSAGRAQSGGGQAAGDRTAAGGKPGGGQAGGEQKPASSGQGMTQQGLQQNWPKIKQMVKKRSPMMDGLLNSVRSFVLKDDQTLVLGFQSEVVKSKMDTLENLDILCKAIQAAVGVAPVVRCIVVGNRSAQSSDLDVDGDGMVGTALDLGGKIVYEE